MNELKYKGRLKIYLALPMFMIVLFLLGAAVLAFYNREIGVVAAVFAVIYSLVVIVFYIANRKHFDEEVLDFAVHQGMAQRAFLRTLRVPYAIVDSETHFTWVNKEFEHTFAFDGENTKSITSLFPEITREIIKKIADSGEVIVPVVFGDDKYQAIISLEMNSVIAQDAEIRAASDEKDILYSVLLLNETEYRRVEQIAMDQRLVACFIYIDNFEDTFDKIEGGLKTVLLAEVDNKINDYFGKRNAIVRQMEKDKYIVLFEHRYLAEMQDTSFPILEEVRVDKNGKEIRLDNGSEITISIGVGYGNATYSGNAQLARMAMDMAQARGGAQAVVRNDQDVSYYGSHGRGMGQRDTVKSRVKANAFRGIMENRDRVIVMGHPLPDADCLGAAVGVYVAARELNIPANIVLNTITSAMKPLVDTFEGYPADMFVDTEKALSLVTKKTLVVVVDTNRPAYVDCPKLLQRCKDVVVFDHHRGKEEKIENPLLEYIEPYASSASEMIAEVLQYFSNRVEMHSVEADCIYAGILIDTNNFMTKTGVRTFEAAAFLRRNGAEVNRVRKLLREDMDTYKARAEVVRNASVYKGAFAMSISDPSGVDSPTILGAKAANELLNIVGIKASFVFTEYQGKIFVSSRSIDEIDVQKIMVELGGGGHLNVAGAQVTDSTIDEVIGRVQSIIDTLIEKGEIKL